MGGDVIFIPPVGHDQGVSAQIAGRNHLSVPGYLFQFNTHFLVGDGIKFKLGCGRVVFV